MPGDGRSELNLISSASAACSPRTARYARPCTAHPGAPVCAVHRQSTRECLPPQPPPAHPPALLRSVCSTPPFPPRDQVRELVHEMLKAAFKGMVESTRNHAAEYLAGGPCSADKITPELRKAMDGTPTTSVLAETMFARIKRRAERGGAARHDTRIGLTMCDRDKTVVWLADKGDKAQGIWNLGRKAWRRGSGRRTVQAERRIKGEAKAPEREAKLAKKVSGRAKKAAELERIKAVEVASKYSELKAMGNDELSDQLKYFKLVERKTGFTTGGTGPTMRLLLQSLIFDKFGAAANDLADGDSGVEGRGVRRRKVGGAGGKGKKRGRGAICSLHGWEWGADELFEIDSLIGKMLADGGDVPGRTRVPAGTVLYKVLWAGFPPEIATWEEEDDIPCGEIDFVAEYEAGLEVEEAADRAAAEEEADSDGEQDAGQ